MFTKILLVDDSISARMIIRQYLEVVGCQGAIFKETANGKEALAALAEEIPDLIVTDMNMPVMNGEALLNRLKASPKYNGIPVLIISSAVNEDNKQHFMKYGANFVIGKPVSPQHLHEAISALSGASP